MWGQGRVGGPNTAHLYVQRAALLPPSCFTSAAPRAFAPYPSVVGLQLEGPSPAAYSLTLQSRHHMSEFPLAQLGAQQTVMQKDQMMGG